MKPIRMYYNEFQPDAAAWLRELVKAGAIAPGDVDERSIADVRAADLSGYTQCHFFAGIGGWAYALRLAGWPDDRPVWTGSCPCQPFSSNGLNKGVEDRRDLWPIFARLIGDCQPATIFGEQVGRAIIHGWLDRLYDDLESMDYAVGSSVFPACSVGAPQERQRLWWLADAQHEGLAVGRRATIARASSSGRERILGFGEKGLPIETGEVVATRDVAKSPDWIRKPSSILLANGLSRPLVELRGFGNAIVPQAAAEFIQAYCEVTA